MCKLRVMQEAPEPILDLADMRRVISKWAVDCGARVQKRREELGFSRSTLAGLTGLTEPTIHRIETGTINPRDHVKVGFAIALMVDVVDLWPYVSRQTALDQAKAAA